MVESISQGMCHGKKMIPLISRMTLIETSSDIEQAFAKVFSDIVALIDDQLQQARKAKLSVTVRSSSHMNYLQSLQRQGIILVGGLGSSAYLYDYLSSRYKSRCIEILQSGGMKP